MLNTRSPAVAFLGPLQQKHCSIIFPVETKKSEEYELASSEGHLESETVGDHWSRHCKRVAVARRRAHHSSTDEQGSLRMGMHKDGVLCRPTNYTVFGMSTTGLEKGLERAQLQD